MADNEKINHEDDSSNGSQPNEKKETIPSEAEKGRRDLYDIESKNVNAVFENPLADVGPEQLVRDVEEFCRQFDMMDHVDVIRKGALIARNPVKGTEVEGLTPEEKEAIINEKAHKWRHPWML